MEYQNHNALSLEASNKFVARVYRWMSIALVLTGIVALYVASDINLMKSIYGNNILFFGLIIGEVALVFYVSSQINNLSFNMAAGLFLLYSALNGVTMAFIFYVYTGASIGLTFFVTAGTFIGMSIYGSITKTDLTGIGNIAKMALFGIIIASIANFFMKSDALSYMISYIGVVVFVALTAYDTQKIMRFALTAQEDNESDRKMSLMGALTLYLDFINLFLMILRILGRRK